MDKSAEYKLMCLKAPEIQEIWRLQDGDFMVSVCSYCGKESEKCTESLPCKRCLEMCNTWVISGHHRGHESISGDSWFFGGSPCVRGAGNLMNETYCFVMNESGTSRFADTFHTSKKSEMLWLPRQDQIQEMFLGGCTGVGKINFFLEYLQVASYNPHTTSLEQLWLMYYMGFKHNKQWNETSNVKEWEPIN